MKLTTWTQFISLCACLGCAAWLGPAGAIAWGIGMVCGAIVLGALERERQEKNSGNVL